MDEHLCSVCLAPDPVCSTGWCISVHEATAHAFSAPFNWAHNGGVLMHPYHASWPSQKFFCLLYFQNNTSPSVLRFSFKSKKSIMLLGALDTFFFPCNFFFLNCSCVYYQVHFGVIKKKKAELLSMADILPYRLECIWSNNNLVKKQVRLFSICYLVKFKFLSLWSCPHLFCTL